MGEKTLKRIEWIATFIAIIGAVLNAFLLKEGFYLWLIFNLLFAIFAYRKKHWGLFCVFCVYFIITVMGIIYWK